MGEKLSQKDLIDALADADEFHVIDKSDLTKGANGTSKRYTGTLQKSYLKAYFDTLYGSGGSGGTITEDTGTTITFTEDTFYNNLTYLTSGNLTLDLTAAVVGTSAWVWCSKYIPTISGENFIITGTPSTSKLNVYKMVYTGVQTDDYDIDIFVDNKTYLSTPTVTITPSDTVNTLSGYGVANATSYNIYSNEVENEYANQAAMLADQGSQTTGKLNKLIDTGVFYEKLAASTADISDYTQITSTEKGTASAVSPAYDGTSATYAHTGLTNGVTHHYWVDAINRSGYLDSVYGVGNGAAASQGFVFNVTAGDSAFQLPLISTGTYNFDIYIDDVLGDTITVWNHADTDIALGDTNPHEIKLLGQIEGWAFSAAGDKDKIYDIENWGTLRFSGSVSQSRWFDGCSNLTVTATDSPDFTGTTSAFYGFRNCTSLTSLPSAGTWDWSSFSSCAGVFQNDASFNEDLDGLTTTSTCTTYADMFHDCSVFNSNLTGLNLSGATTLASMLRDCQAFNGNMNWAQINSVLANGFGSMFNNADAFNKDISAIDYTATNGTIGNYIFNNGGTFSTANYDLVLVALEAQVVAATPAMDNGSIRIDANYTSAGAGGTARTSLTGTYGWSVTDLGGI